MQSPQQQALYRELSKHNLYTKSYEDFQQQFRTPEAQDLLHGKLSEHGLLTIDTQTFRSRYFGGDSTINSTPAAEPDETEVVIDAAERAALDAQNRVEASMFKQRVIGSGDIDRMPEFQAAAPSSTGVRIPAVEGLAMARADEPVQQRITQAAAQATESQKDPEFGQYVDTKERLQAQRDAIKEQLEAMERDAPKQIQTSATGAAASAMIRRAPQYTEEQIQQRKQLRDQMRKVNRDIAAMEKERVGRDAMDSLADQIKSVEIEAAKLQDPESLREAREQIRELEGQYEDLGISLDSFTTPEMIKRRLSNAWQRAARTGVEMTAATAEGLTILQRDLEDLMWMGADEDKPERKDLKDLALFEYTHRMKEWAEEAFPGKPEVQGEFISDVLPGAMASFAMFIGAGGLARATIGGAGVVSTLLAGTGGMSQMYNEAIEAGASEDDARLAARWGIIPGVLQVLPVIRVLDRYDRAAGGQLKPHLTRYFIEGAKGGIEEFLAESLGQAGFNLVAQQIFDNERELLQDVAQQGAAGGVAGFLASAFLTAIGGRGGKRITYNPESPELQIIRDRVRDASAPGPAEYRVDGETVTKKALERKLTDPEFISKAITGEETFEIKNDPYLAVLAQQAVDQVMNQQSTQGDTATADEAGGDVAAVDADPPAPPASSVTPSDAQAEPSISVGEALEQGGIYEYEGHRGALVRDGQVVVLESGNQIFELGNAEQLAETGIADVGLTRESTLDIQVAEDSYSVTVDGKTYANNYSDPKAAINYNEAGDVVSVNLNTEDGRSRTFRGDRAEEIAYQYELKSFQTNATEQDITTLTERVDAAIRASEETGQVAGEAADTPAPQPQPGAGAAAATGEADAGVTTPPTEGDTAPGLGPADDGTPAGQGYGQRNTLVTAERAEQVRAELRSKLGQLNMGLDPQTLRLSTELALYHLEAGAREFSDFTRAMINDLGEAITPHLARIYNEARKSPQIVEAGIHEQMNDIAVTEAETADSPAPQPGDAGEGAPPSPPSHVIPEQFPNGYDPTGSMMPGFFSNALLGWRNTFESASDKLRRKSDGSRRTLQEIQQTEKVAGALSKGEADAGVDASTIDAMAPLAELVDLVFDRQQANTGEFNRLMAEPVRRATRADKKEFEKWAQAWDQKQTDQAQQIYDKMSETGKNLVDAWRRTADMTGTRNQRGGVKVYDPKKGKMRPIGKIETYYPRRLQEWAMNALYAPTRHPAEKARVVRLLIENGIAKDAADAEKFIRANGPAADKTSSDYFSAMEKARTDGFPPEMYDYSLETALDYGKRWAERLAQIETFGQDGAGFGEVFDRIIRKVQDPVLKRYLGRVRSRVYNESPTDPLGRGIATLNMMATGLQLGNHRTAAQNFITGSGLNYVAFGRYALQTQLKALRMDAAAVKDAEAIGVLQDDILSVQRDLAESPNSLLSKFTGGTMKWGGYTITERQIRLHALLSGKLIVRDLIKHAGKNPYSHRSKQLIAWMQRNNFDYTKLLAENGQGEYTNRVLRYIVNLPQGSYKVNMTPVLVDEPMGRFLFKYRKYGTQVERLKWLNHIEPFMDSIKGGERVQIKDPVSGEMVDKRAYDFVAMMRLLTIPPVYGYLNKWVRWRYFGTLGALAGPDWSDLLKALDDDDESLTVALALQIVWESVIMSGILGNLQTPVQLGRDISEMKSVTNPADPPAAGFLKSTWDLMEKWRDQGRVTGSDIHIWANRTVSIYNSTIGNKGSQMLMVEMGMDQPHIDEYRLRRAAVQKEMRRYAEDVGLPESKTRPAGSGFRSTPQTPVNRDISNAIVLGRPEQARAILREHLNTLKTADEIRAATQSARTHVRNRQPIVLGGQFNNTDRENFLDWAEQNLHKDKLAWVKEADETYRKNATAANLMAEETPSATKSRQRRVQKGSAELTEAQRRRLYRDLLGRDATQ